MRLKDLDGQLQLDLVDIPKREPFNCPHELKVVDIGERIAIVDALIRD